MISWRFSSFDDLTPRDVHEIFRVRIEVFVIEQNCPFQDVDGADLPSWHLLGTNGSSDLVAYCRLVPPGVKFAEPSIGRIITTSQVRGKGLGRELVKESLVRAETLWPGQSIRIGAQARLEKFYNEFGFVKSSDPYDEDGILHIEMLLPKGRS
ncbi:GNAT family N-acetyltransferase [Usitatibacter palustris]|uniref:Protein ElaA n=1 Tax=Usitatibacter palustris TaxID=2732487 RepID=A0A6M4H5E3_9PROT|nr:GNAT family N-acetyltransferase [Usitatibacter palustris]QJR14168.1 Protein ElaA [Usitatibacter palustris]